MKFLKSLFTAVALLAAVLTTQAQQLQSLVTTAANTATNLLSGAYVIDNFIAINATTNNVTLKFWDSSDNTTNIVQAAYTSYSRYATNYSTVITNESGFVYTNTFAGIYTQPTAVTTSTNAKPVIQIMLIPAGLTLNKDVRMITLRGLTAASSDVLTLLTTYRLP